MSTGSRNMASLHTATEAQTMYSHLPNLPVELTELIMRDLALDALRSLRLVCHALRDSVSGTKQFTDSFKHQRRRLIECDVRMLLGLAKHETLSQYVTALTLVIPVYNGGTLRRMIETRKRVTHVDMVNHQPVDVTVDCDEAALEQARDDLLWMTSQNVAHGADTHTELLAKTLCGLPKLRSLTIEAAVLSSPGLDSIDHPGDRHTPAWQARWLYVARGCSTVLSAVVEAKPRLQTLHVLPNVSSRALTLPQLASVVDLLEERNFLITTANSLKTLSFRVASDIRHKLQYEDHPPNEYNPSIPLSPEDDGYYISLSSCAWTRPNSATPDHDQSMLTATGRLIAMIPGLETLDLHFSDPAHRSGTAAGSCEIFDAIAARVRLPVLGSFSLRGFYCTASSLFSFLQNHPTLTYLGLHNIRLTQGNWQPIFDHIRTMPYLQDVLLDSIWADTLVHLGMQGDSQEVWAVKKDWFPRRGGGRGVPRLLHTRRFTRAQLQQGLNFITYTRNGPLDSPQSRRWHMDLGVEYRSR